MLCDASIVSSPLFICLEKLSLITVVIVIIRITFEVFVVCLSVCLSLPLSLSLVTFVAISMGVVTADPRANVAEMW